MSFLSPRHGDMLYLIGNTATRGAEASSVMEFSSSTASVSTDSSTASSANNHRSEHVQEDEVDVYLGKQDGRIARSRNDRL